VCHLLQAHLALESQPRFRLILYWIRLLLDKSNRAVRKFGSHLSVNVNEGGVL
jgi:hypothetical protein